MPVTVLITGNVAGTGKATAYRFKNSDFFLAFIIATFITFGPLFEEIISKFLYRK